MGHRHSVLWPDRRVKPPYGSVEIDWGHPLAQGLVLYAPMNNGAGVPSLLTPGALTVVGSALAWTGSPVGLGVVGDGASAYSIPAPITSYPFTMASWFRVTADGAALALLTLADTAGTTNYHYLVARMADGDQLHMRTYNGTAATGTVGKIVLGVDYFGAGVVESAEARWAYLNGIVGATQTTSKTPTSLDTFGVGAVVHSSSTAHFVGNIYGSAIWSRALSVADLSWLYADPYCFLRPVIRRSYGFVGAAAGGWKPAWAVRPSRTIGTGVI